MKLFQIIAYDLDDSGPKHFLIQGDAVETRTTKNNNNVVIVLKGNDTVFSLATKHWMVQTYKYPDLTQDDIDDIPAWVRGGDTKRYRLLRWNILGYNKNTGVTAVEFCGVCDRKLVNSEVLILSRHFAMVQDAAQDCVYFTRDEDYVRFPDLGIICELRSSSDGSIQLGEEHQTCPYMAETDNKTVTEPLPGDDPDEYKLIKITELQDLDDPDNDKIAIRLHGENKTSNLEIKVYVGSLTLKELKKQLAHGKPGFINYNNYAQLKHCGIFSGTLEKIPGQPCELTPHEEFTVVVEKFTVTAINNDPHHKIVWFYGERCEDQEHISATRETTTELANNIKKGATLTVKNGQITHVFCPTTYYLVEPPVLVEHSPKEDDYYANIGLKEVKTGQIKTLCGVKMTGQQYQMLKLGTYVTIQDNEVISVSNMLPGHISKQISPG